MKRVWVLLLGVALGVAVAVPLTAWASGHDQRDAGDTHSTMHAMMEAMHGEGSSERMHEAMPGSEAMMEECGSMMEGMDMDGMMQGGGMMDDRGMTQDRMMGR